MAQITKRTVMIEIEWLQKIKKELHNAKTKADTILWSTELKISKKHYRKLLKEYHAQFEYSFDRVFNDNGMDGFTAYIIMPDHVKSREEAKEYYTDCLEERCLPSMYDCTGQRFNYLLTVQKRSNGRYGAYVRYCYDF